MTVRALIVIAGGLSLGAPAAEALAQADPSAPLSQAEPTATAQPAPPPLEREDVRAVTEQVACHCGCRHMAVADCYCGTANAIRADIAADLDEGQSVQQIVEAYLAEHGFDYRAVPPKAGVHWMIWLLPIILLVAGTILVYTLGRRLTAAPVISGPIPAPDASAVDAETKERLREELARAVEAAES